MPLEPYRDPGEWKTTECVFCGEPMPDNAKFAEHLEECPEAPR